MIVAGVMSGTSADGINVALVQIEDPAKSRGRGRPCNTGFRLLAHAEYSYPKAVRNAVLAAMNSAHSNVADLARLNFLLGELYAEALLTTQKRFRLEAELVGCHGQTLYHQGEAAKFLGREIATTWQTGEGAIVAARLGVPVVSDFRPADMAAGGKGAPLVPFLDYLLYRDEEVGRVVQNIGGIANLTAIPAAAAAEEVLAFDTGPGNMVMDALSERCFGRPYDRGGKFAAAGEAGKGVVDRLLQAKFFRRRPPKTAGREEFGREFAREFLRRCGKAKKQDVLATATLLTARSIAQAIERFLLPGSAYAELIVSGGGTKNPTLMKMLSSEISPFGLKLRYSDEFGLPSQAKEAAAFALLAYESFRRRPSNIPSATGARRPAILGKISYA